VRICNRHHPAAASKALIVPPFQRRTVDTAKNNKNTKFPAPMTSSPPNGAGNSLNTVDKRNNQLVAPGDRLLTVRIPAAYSFFHRISF